MQQIFYNKDNVVIDNFIYDSKTDILVAHFKTIKIRLSENEKSEILSYYKELDTKNSCVCVQHEDGSSTKSSFYYSYPKNKCDYSTNKHEIEKHLLLNVKVIRFLKESAEYKRNFSEPDEYQNILQIFIYSLTSYISGQALGMVLQRVPVVAE